MMDTAIILASHGSFAQGAREAAEMIVGAQENLAVLSITEEKDLETGVAELFSLAQGLDCTNGVLVLVDMFGGTPCNAACRLLLEAKHPVELLAGFNLPVLLEVCSNREVCAQELAQLAKVRYSESLVDLKEMLTESGDDDANQLG